MGTDTVGAEPNESVVTVPDVSGALATCVPAGEYKSTSPLLAVIFVARPPSTRLTKYTREMMLGRPPAKPGAGGNTTWYQSDAAEQPACNSLPLAASAKGSACKSPPYAGVAPLVVVSDEVDAVAPPATAPTLRPN